jgi:hypothetical protein
LNTGGGMLWLAGVVTDVGTGRLAAGRGAGSAAPPVGNPLCCALVTSISMLIGPDCPDACLCSMVRLIAAWRLVLSHWGDPDDLNITSIPDISVTTSPGLAIRGADVMLPTLGDVD